MNKFKREIHVIQGEIEMIVRVMENGDYKGEAFAQLRIFDGKIYAYVAEKNLMEFFRDLCR